MTRNLSIFIDESGDFGDYDSKSPYYLVTMLFHDQNHNILKSLDNLSSVLIAKGYPDHILHMGPLIRKEEIYKDMTIDERKKILNTFMAFLYNIQFSYKTFIIEKSNKVNQYKLISLLSQSIRDFLGERLDFITSFDKIVVYYDDGQKQLTQVLASIFTYSNCEFRPNIIPADYRLFQIADLLTTFELINKKREDNRNSNSEKQFFKSMRNFNKDYYKRLAKKKL